MSKAIIALVIILFIPFLIIGVFVRICVMAFDATKAGYDFTDEFLRNSYSDNFERKRA